ncbi:MAG: hypothetical protein JW795_15020 [Chitinivibrionales bacterium]|nr:hypothetical protein [Chitinivibrionales bacterium]
MMNKFVLFALTIVYWNINTISSYATVLFAPESGVKPFHLIAPYHDETEIVVEFHLPQVLTREGNNERGGIELIIDHEDAVWPQPGAPSMQAIQCMVRIPATGSVTIELLEQETDTIVDYSVAPYQKQLPIGMEGYAGDMSENSFTIDEQIYGIDALYPQSVATVVRCQILREIRIAIIQLNPLRYNPVTHQLTITKLARLAVRSIGGRAENELSMVDREFTPSFSPLYREVVNFDCSDMPRSPSKVGCYAFIGNAANLEAVRDLIDWKKRKGYDVRIGVSGSDSVPATTAGIDKWIETAYSTWPNKPEYILLVGNEKVIPPGSVSDPIISKSPSDNLFGVIGTSGKIPSIHVGRITGDKSGSSDDPAVLKYIAGKIVMHEKEPFEGGWLTQAETWGCKQQTGIEIAKAWATTMNKAFNSVVTGTDQASQNKTTAQDLVSHLTAGKAMFGYVGHGNPTTWSSVSFSASLVASLANNRMLPWIVSIACNVAAFSGRYCLVENFMSEGTIENPKGALGMFGFSVESNDMMNNQIGNLLKCYFEQNTWHMGACATYGKKFPGDNTNDQDGSMTWGCPEIDIYTINPLKTLKVEYTNLTSGGACTLSVSDGSAAVSKGLIGIVTNTYQMLASGFTDASGKATLKLSTIPAGTDSIFLTVTSHNCKPFLYTVKNGSTAATGFQAPSEASFVVRNIRKNGMQSAILMSIEVPFAGTIDCEVFDVKGGNLFSSKYPVRKGHNAIVLQGNTNRRVDFACGMRLVRVSYGSSVITKQALFIQ